MSVSRKSAPRASRPYVTTVYRALAGSMEAVIPGQGPCGCAGSSCRIGIHHLRDRKTGVPWGFVAVAFCKVHGVHFTLYPPGTVPYGREPWVELGPDGGALEQGEGEEACPASSGYFDAVQDAAEGKRWPVDSAPTPPGAVRTTQRRRMARAAAIVGLEAGLEPETAAVAEVTHLPTGDLLEVLGRLALARDLVSRGQEIWRVFSELTGLAGCALMDRLAVLGHMAGLWGHPYRWRPVVSSLLELGRPFWRDAVLGTAGSPATPKANGAFNDLGTGPPP